MLPAEPGGNAASAEGEEPMKNSKAVFRNLQKRLEESSWFRDDWYIYNRGEYLQVYKDDWHNHNQGGIHFETFIEANEIRKKEFPICVHAEEDCPSQTQFIEELLAIEGDRIRGWKGYKALGTGYSICERKLPLNFKNLEQRLLEEFNRLSQFEASVEQVLKRIGAS